MIKIDKDKQKSILKEAYDFALKHLTNVMILSVAGYYTVWITTYEKMVKDKFAPIKFLVLMIASYILSEVAGLIFGAIYNYRLQTEQVITVKMVWSQIVICGLLTLASLACYGISIWYFIYGLPWN